MAKFVLTNGQEIEIKPLKMKYVLEANKLYKKSDEKIKEVYLVSKATDLTMDDIEELDFKDYNKLVSEIFEVGE